jgi:hypothetical protein
MKQEAASRRRRGEVEGNGLRRMRALDDDH